MAARSRPLIAPTRRARSSGIGSTTSLWSTSTANGIPRNGRGVHAAGRSPKASSLELIFRLTPEGVDEPTGRRSRHGDGHRRTCAVTSRRMNHQCQATPTHGRPGPHRQPTAPWSGPTLNTSATGEGTRLRAPQAAVGDCLDQRWIDASRRRVRRLSDHGRRPGSTRVEIPRARACARERELGVRNRRSCTRPHVDPTAEGGTRLVRRNCRPIRRAARRRRG